MIDQIVRQLPLVLGIWACCLTGPAIAVFFLQRRKRRARAARRSPLVSDLLRGPGHSLLDQIIEVQDDFSYNAALLMIVPLGLLCATFAQTILEGHTSWVFVAVVVLMGLGHLVFVVRRLVQTGDRLDRLRIGYDGEVAVGQELDRLMRQGAHVFHDVPAERFNVDHVVVSPQGVFAVETKGYRKPADGGSSNARVIFDGSQLAFPDWKTRQPLEQAARQSAWLAKWLSSATGDTVSVLPVVALPGWFVERKGQGQVRVYAGGELPQLLQARGAAPLDAGQLQRVTHQLEQRVRTVTPQYRDDSTTVET